MIYDQLIWMRKLVRKIINNWGKLKQSVGN